MPNTTLEERIASLEGSYKELTKRIDDLRSEMHRGFDGIRAELNELRSQISDLRAQGKADSSQLRAELSEARAEWRTSFRWTMSLILINWLSVLAAIFLVAARK